MSTRLGVLVCLVGIVFLTACSAHSPENYLAEDYGEIGADIYLQPEQAEQILSGTGLSPEEFREELKEISRDPDRARRYRWAFERRLIAAGELPGPGTGGAPGGSAPPRRPGAF